MANMAQLFGQPMGNPIQFAYQTDPKIALAKSLIDAGAKATPVNHPVEGVARLASALAGAWLGHKAQGEYEQRIKDYGDTLARATQAGQPWKAPDDVMGADGKVVVQRGQDAPGTGGFDAMAQVLASNADTAPLGLNMAFDRMQSRQKLADEQAAKGWEYANDPSKRYRLEDGTLVDLAGQGGPRVVMDGLKPKYQERNFSVGGDRIQPQVSRDGGRTWENLGDAYDRREPFIIQQIYNPETGSMEQVAVPRAAVTAAMGARVQPQSAQPAMPGQAQGAVPAPGGIPGAVSLGGGKPEKPTDVQSGAAGYASRMQNAEAILGSLAQTGFNPGNYADHLKGAIPYLGNTLVSDQFRQYRQAAEDWVRAKLRKESGAVIGQQEMNDEIRTYFPQPGDDQKTIEQKAYARQVAALGMIGQAGSAFDPRKQMRPFGSDSAPGLPKVGDVQDGYQFLGGNPADQRSWKKVR